MLKKLKNLMLNNLASVIVLVAMTGVSARSIWYFYEPDIPESLKNRD
ncbi:MAG: cyclic lactone autoinducer peptide [Clostridia bacterium]